MSSQSSPGLTQHQRRRKRQGPGRTLAPEGTGEASEEASQGVQHAHESPEAHDARNAESKPEQKEKKTKKPEKTGEGSKEKEKKSKQPGKKMGGIITGSDTTATWDPTEATFDRSIERKEVVSRTRLKLDNDLTLGQTRLIDVDRVEEIRRNMQEDPLPARELSCILSFLHGMPRALW